MNRFIGCAALVAALLSASATTAFAFVPRPKFGAPYLSDAGKVLRMSSETAPSSSVTPNYNAVHVAKTGGRGSRTAGQAAFESGLSLGAPIALRPGGGHFLTRGGVQVTAHVEEVQHSNKPIVGGEQTNSASMIEDLVDKLDTRRGVLLSSSYEFPGRYARWSVGFTDPPLEISGRGQKCTVRALNKRGMVLLPAVTGAMQQMKEEGTLENVQIEDGKVEVTVVPPPPVGTFSEEERSRQPSLFSVVRSLVDLFGVSPAIAESVDGGQFGLYGSFGYDLTFQFEPIKLAQERPDNQRDILLYLPDEILVVDQNRGDAWKMAYDFSFDGKSTQGMERSGEAAPFEPYDEESGEFNDRDTPLGEFTESVERAKREFAVGNLFEAVLSQTFRRKLDESNKPSSIFRRLRSRNPAPYGFFMNLGEDEFLVGASPEMFVRCEATDENAYFPGAVRVETCPISGTVARGADALEDALRVKSLIMNAKEESELTMCTDVDRNDKSRICIPGSVQVIGRRQIEMYSRLIHTVDHVEGYLRPEFDALDAFLCHTWAVTVTGAPKTWAIQFVEDNERSSRAWYGGAVGMVGFDGGLNTGLTLRTVRVKNGIAEVRAGATLLYDSDPAAEELETELKASAMIDAVVEKGPEDEGHLQADSTPTEEKIEMVGEGKHIILIDHEDSFVHTLGNYLRQTGAEVKTLRSGPSALDTIEQMIKEGNKPDMVVLSPGPGNPSDFALSTTLSFLVKNRIPGFGVCLGLQGMVEHFGGTLGVLGYPLHGKPTPVSLTPLGKSDDSIFRGIPETFDVARYHSLHGIKDKLPSCLEVTALSEDGIVMGIKHAELPYAAVQFHPESILTNPAHGMMILKNALAFLHYDADAQLEQSHN
uniref:p-aminobenzoic acid synthase n=1 Tax=Odontella aurita TaxID=265563 RepID=A0A7S4I3J4_9STRA|mmetsp:Transcript_19357/g.56557  ORF Transcript_19357/g.56557 Transcript_19357/m.56557 type:complete len:876 (+) Transcript_19357:196-2823(+)